MSINTQSRSLLIPIFMLGLSVVSLTVISRADIVIDWNIIATSAGPAAGKNPLEQSRIYAMTHTAIYDALNGIDRRYRPYAVDRRAEPGASPEAAVAAAAYGVLVELLPSQQATLKAAYDASLAGIIDGPAKDSGIAIGQAAAVAILALRSADGSTAPMPYTPGTDPGDYQLTPPNFAPAVLPGWGNVTPFALTSGAQFRLPPSKFLDLTSNRYTDDYNEVKAIGDLNSATRTAEQSEIARFWYEGSPTGWNRIARVVAAQRELDLWQNARLFGLLNFAMADGFIAGFDSKYHYDFWRPITAIRAGATDNNPATVADPAWMAFLVTPAAPDYPSTHSVLGAAAAEVLARFFGTDAVSFTATSGAPFPGITRSFTSFSQAARENADSRIYAGIHFRTACRHGLSQGKQVGRYVFKHALQPVFDTCLQDDQNGDILRVSSTSGDYQFIRCGADDFTLGGRGSVLRFGCVLILVNSQVHAVINRCRIESHDRGQAIVHATPQGPVFVIKDRNAGNSGCECR
jgi:PAP2 superfamily